MEICSLQLNFTLTLEFRKKEFSFLESFPVSLEEHCHVLLKRESLGKGTEPKACSGSCRVFVVFEWCRYTFPTAGRTAPSLEHSGLCDFWVTCKHSYPPKSILVSSTYNLFLWVIIQVSFQAFSQKCSCNSLTLGYFGLEFVQEVWRV